MNKVYFNVEKNQWFVFEPEDLYLFKSSKIKTSEEENQILSWTRGFDMTAYPNHVRVYDVEISGVKYFFLMKPQENIYLLESENPLMLERLIDTDGILFVGETMNS